MTTDGLWYEGTIAYQFYVIQAVEATLDAAKRAGWDFAGDARLKSVWLGPMRFTYPDGSYPVFHDSDPGNLRNYRGYYLWAYNYFKEPRFAELAGLPADKAAPLGTANMTGIGVAALRRPNGANPLCAMIDPILPPAAGALLGAYELAGEPVSAITHKIDVIKTEVSRYDHH